MSVLTDKINKCIGEAVFVSNIDKKELTNIFLEIAELAEGGGNRIFHGLISQTGNSAPTLIEQKSSLGFALEPQFNSDGTYTIPLPETININKVNVQLTASTNAGSNSFVACDVIEGISDGLINIFTSTILSPNGANDVLNKASIIVTILD